MQLGDLLIEAGLELPACKEILESEITGVVSHSRAVQKGNLFVALRGVSCDGTQYVSEALARGAAFVVSERAKANDAGGKRPRCAFLLDGCLLRAPRPRHVFDWDHGHERQDLYSDNAVSHPTKCRSAHGLDRYGGVPLYGRGAENRA